MMNFWRHHRRASGIARAMLVVWCFALVSSWAHACLLQSRASLHDHERAYQGAARLFLAAVGEASDPGADTDDVHGHDDAGGARALCQSVCDDEQATVPKLAPPAMTDLGPPGFVPTEPWSFCAAEAQFPSGWIQAAAPPPEAPVAIRFLRLTI